MNRQRIGEVAAALLGYCENNSTFQTDGIVTVPASSYDSVEQWHAERDRIFRRLPLMLALSCEMPRPGDYKAAEMVGLPVLMARDKAGRVRAFLNVCAHRWAPVAPEGLGHCAHFRFTCPFHGWTYGTDGKLTGIADRAKFGTIDKAAHGLRELPCEERHGMIFVCLTPGAPLDLDAFYGALLDEYAGFGLQSWTFLGSSTLEGPNWKLIWTNFLESYHFAAQHPATVALQWVPNVIHYEGFGPHLRVGFALRSIANLRAVPREQWGEQEGHHFTFMRYLFPSVVGSLYPGGISIFTQLFPGSTPDKTRVVTLWLRNAPLKDDADRQKVDSELQNFIQAAAATLRDEDFATGIATQKALGSNAHEGFLYGRNERGPQYFHEWVTWYLQNDPTLQKPVL